MARDRKLRLRDQYGDKVPNDLVLPPMMEAINDEQLKVIMAADWYEVEGKGYAILMSFRQIKGLSEADPLDADIDLSAKGIKVFRINECLKRYSDEDGFYHA